MEAAQCEWVLEGPSGVAAATAKLETALGLAAFYELPLTHAHALDRLAAIMTTQESFSRAEAYQQQLVALLERYAPESSLLRYTLGSLTMGIAGPSNNPSAHTLLQCAGYGCRGRVRSPQRFDAPAALSVPGFSAALATSMRLGRLLWKRLTARLKGHLPVR